MNPEIRQEQLPEAVGKMLMEVLRRTHLSPTHEVAAVVAEEARRVGIDSLLLYLVDYEQRTLVPIPVPGAEPREPVSVQGTMAGRSFTGGSVVDMKVDEGRRLWLPLLDGTERVGVGEVTFAGTQDVTPALLTACERYLDFVSDLLIAKDRHSDVLKMVRRRKPMTTAGELLRELIPPQVMATDKLVLAAMLEPAYDVGGDAYDYALNDNTLHLAIFDGVGHGLAAAGVTTFALSVYRHSRRCGDDLAAMYQAIDTEVAEQYPAGRYVTACIANLDIAQGRLRWISAGHPPPLLLRRGRFVKALAVQPSTPLGTALAERAPTVGKESLEPGDMVLLYTDGLTEARRPDGTLFTTERLAEFIERQAATGAPAPETLRLLREAIIERREGALRDDASALLLEWRRDTHRSLLPFDA